MSMRRRRRRRGKSVSVCYGMIRKVRMMMRVIIILHML